MAPEEELRAEIERLRARNENLKKPQQRVRHVAESQRRRWLSVYGWGRFPVTLYREQGELLGMSDQIREFIHRTIRYSEEGVRRPAILFTQFRRAGKYWYFGNGTLYGPAG